MTHGQELTAAVVDYLANIEAICRRVGHPKARAVIVIRGPADEKLGGGCTGLMIEGITRGTKHFAGLDAGEAYACALSPPYETGIAAWFEMPAPEAEAA